MYTYELFDVKLENFSSLKIFEILPRNEKKANNISQVVNYGILKNSQFFRKFCFNREKVASLLQNEYKKVIFLNTIQMLFFLPM